MNVLLILTVFLLAADQFLFTGFLSRPLPACTLIGAVCGNTGAGVMAGGALEMLLAGQDVSVRVLDRRSYVLCSCAAVILVSAAGLKPEAAAGIAAVLIAAGTGLNHLLSILFTSFLAPARNAAETRNETKLAVTHFLPVVLASAVFAVCAAVLYGMIQTKSDSIAALAADYRWVYKGLCAAGSLLPCVGLAILLRNLSVKDMKGAFWAGAASASMITAALSPASALALCAAIAFGAAGYDYHRLTEGQTPAKTQKGGAQKWW
ncbi:MAG: PTS sugar transporter subunit IIC [Solobacterium sp.]|nr:PTS sugar transporter subunit IIC [Solobacterium sp.]